MMAANINNCHAARAKSPPFFTDHHPSSSQFQVFFLPRPYLVAASPNEHCQMSLDKWERDSVPNNVCPKARM